MTYYYLHNNGVIRDTVECPGEGVYCKPQLVAVIPVEDREQVQRLVGLFEVQRGESLFSKDDQHMQAALREFADPMPPKPEEPTDPATRVRAYDTQWAKVTTWWISPAIAEHPRRWDSLIEADDFEVVQP